MRPKKNELAVASRFGDDLVLFQAMSKQYFVLNGVAARIWELCDGGRTLSQIATAISAEFAAPKSLGEDVRTTVAGLEAFGLIEDAAEGYEQ